MDQVQKVKGKVFRDLHSVAGIFVMPNAWNVGSACMLEEAGFPAVGTTSAGIAFCMGLPDYEGVLTREAALDEARRIAGAVRLPVSVDAENGYGHSPEEVAETIRLVAETGAVGASIEDFAAAYGTGELYDRLLAVERIEAAAAMAASLPFPFTLTARAESYIVGHPNPFAESVARATSYREAGADCLYVPGISDAVTIGRLVKEVNAPVNVVMGLTGNSMSVRQLEDLGVKRVSIGGSLARATFGLIRQASAEIRDHGTFGYAEAQVPDSELCEFFAGRQN
ncbi:MAG: isocitrate lyase/phosphoenolpyruvate mutase family protein [Paracoccaceae bacterium]|nr:isocitrate lyase/phosphoenolpyruvate mutase family protein [Paracoccaceae bacterium]MDE2913160.1 isocitrate lyase/phosphoenolpyruvate mutase family protein [Paracoccaceae bacterium]